LRIAGAVVLATASATGCGSGDSSGEGVAAPGTQESESASNESHWIATRLELLPVPDGLDSAVEVRVGDLDRVTDLAGVPRPMDMSDRQGLSDWQYAILGDATASPAPATASLVGAQLRCPTHRRRLPIWTRTTGAAVMVVGARTCLMSARCRGDAT
jgi:hypothetical protein